MATTTAEARSVRNLFLATFAVFTTAIVSVVPWRIGDLYDGGVDPVVIAKAIVGFAAFGFAALLYLKVPVRGSVGIRSLALAGSIVAISAVGAFAAGDATAALVLTVRIVLVAATMVVVVKCAPPRTVLTALLAAMSAVGIVAAVTGFQHGLNDGRLYGGIPQMAPNVLAGLVAPPAIGLAADIVRRGLRPWNVGLLIANVAIIFATGSRTALIVVVIGIALAFVFGGRLAPSTAVVTIAAIPFAYALVAFTDTVATLLSRGQSIEQLSTLSQRTVAWQAVLATPFNSWAKWIGVGLAAKTVEVQQKYRDVQVLDSSWVSVIAQAGLIGTALLAIWFVLTTAQSLRNRDLGALTTPLMAMIIIRSFTENGVIESSPTFMLFLGISMLLERGTRYPGRAKPEPTYQLATPLPIARRESSRA